jgi:hypothetical protein
VPSAGVDLLHVERLKVGRTYVGSIVSRAVSFGRK